MLDKPTAKRYNINKEATATSGSPYRLVMII